MVEAVAGDDSAAMAEVLAAAFPNVLNASAAFIASSRVNVLPSCGIHGHTTQVAPTAFASAKAACRPSLNRSKPMWAEG